MMLKNNENFRYDNKTFKKKILIFNTFTGI